MTLPDQTPEKLEALANPRKRLPIYGRRKILLDAAMAAIAECGKKLREDGWDPVMTVEAIPDLHITLTIAIDVGPPVEAE